MYMYKNVKSNSKNVVHVHKKSILFVHVHTEVYCLLNQMRNLF